MSRVEIQITTNGINQNDYFFKSNQKVEDRFSILQYIYAIIQDVNTVTPDSASEQLLNKAEIVYKDFTDDLGYFGWFQRLLGVIERFFGYRSHVLDFDDEYTKIANITARHLVEYKNSLNISFLKFQDHVSSNKIGETIPGIMNCDTGELEFLNREIDLYEGSKSQTKILWEIIEKKQSSAVLHPCIIVITNDSNNYYRRIYNVAKCINDLHPRILIAYTENCTHDRGTFLDCARTEFTKKIVNDFEEKIKDMKFV